MAVGAFTFGASFLVLWAMKATFGIRTDAEAEAAGLDVSEHGMWGYPELFSSGAGRLRHRRLAGRERRVAADAGSRSRLGRA